MNFRNSFNNCFRDSYGWDKLSIYFALFGAVMLVLSRKLLVFGIVLIGFAVWRSFSKNKYKRYQEEAAFENLISRFKYGWGNIGLNFKDKLHYKVFTCPNCSQKLRVPRHKGKITITCKRCSTQFKGRS